MYNCIAVAGWWLVVVRPSAQKWVSNMVHLTLILFPLAGLLFRSDIHSGRVAGWQVAGSGRVQGGRETSICERVRRKEREEGWTSDTKVPCSFGLSFAPCHGQPAAAGPLEIQGRSSLIFGAINHDKIRIHIRRCTVWMYCTVQGFPAL